MALERRRTKTKKYNILYVDDEAANLRVFKSVFKRDYKVFIAESGMDAMTILKENPIHLLVTDQRMPGMSGVELLENVVDDHPQMVKMILSGFSDVEDIIKAVNECGLDKYLMKPWNKEDLGATFDKALAKFDSNEDKNEIHIVKKALQENEKYAHKQIHALLPKDNTLKSFFSESFALYKPVNDLGGIFYWFASTNDKKGIMVAVDCNEKGVKGALLTMLFETALKEIVHTNKTYEAIEILTGLDAHFKENSSPTEEESQEVGYNVSVVVVDQAKQYMSFAGAGQNLLYQDANNDIEIAEGGNNQIGGGSNAVKEFGTFSGSFDEVKAIYLVGSTTEGQLNTSARTTNLVNILDDIAERDFNEQKEELMITLAESISGTEQKYDVMIIGAKL